jgi:hypothetical protein
MVRAVAPSPDPATERTYISREFYQFFSTFPTVAEGFQLKTVRRQSGWWRATIRMDDAGFGRRSGVARP